MASLQLHTCPFHGLMPYKFVMYTFTNSHFHLLVCDLYDHTFISSTNLSDLMFARTFLRTFRFTCVYVISTNLLSVFHQNRFPVQLLLTLRFTCMISESTMEVGRRNKSDIKYIVELRVDFDRTDKPMAW